MQRSTIAKSLLAGGLVLFAAVDALAVTYPSGTIQSLYFSGETNYSVRVFLSGVTDPCGNGGSAFAFINAGDSNYKVYVAGLMLAKAQGNMINLVVTPDSSNPSLCHLIEFSVGN
jgi:hypothetical protein